MPKSGDDGAPSTPVGAMRRPFSSTSVRLAPRPRRFAVVEPGPVVEHEAVERQIELHARGRAGLLQDLAGVDEAGLALDVGADDLQRRDARVGAAPDTRAGDDDLFDACLLGLRQGRRRGFVFGLLLLYRFGGVFGLGLLRQRRRRGDKPSEGQDRCEQQGRLGEVGLRRPSRHAQANDELRESHGGSPLRLALRTAALQVPRLGRTLSNLAALFRTLPAQCQHLQHPFCTFLPPEQGNALDEICRGGRRFGRPTPRKVSPGLLGRSRVGNQAFMDKPLAHHGAMRLPGLPRRPIGLECAEARRPACRRETGSVRHTAAIDSAQSAPPRHILSCDQPCPTDTVGCFAPASAVALLPFIGYEVVRQHATWLLNQRCPRRHGAGVPVGDGVGPRIRG